MIKPDPKELGEMPKWAKLTLSLGRYAMECDGECTRKVQPGEDFYRKFEGNHNIKFICTGCYYKETLK